MNKWVLFHANVLTIQPMLVRPSDKCPHSPSSSAVSPGGCSFEHADEKPPSFYHFWSSTSSDWSQYQCWDGSKGELWKGISLGPSGRVFLWGSFHIQYFSFPIQSGLTQGMTSREHEVKCTCFCYNRGLEVLIIPLAWAKNSCIKFHSPNI